MKTGALSAWLLILAVGCASARPPAQAKPADPRLKVLVVTGGHGFAAGPFFKMFADDAGITFTAVTQGKAAEAYDRDDLFSYDVVVLYDSPTDITEAQRARFLALFDRGIGVVVLHHALLSYQKWPAFEALVGGKYMLDVETDGDKVTPESTYKSNADIPIRIVSPEHPVTAGLADFTLHDELYEGVRMRPDVTALMVTGDEVLAWAALRGKSRVVATVLGHGRSAYEDPRFLRFFAQSLRWTARH
jgi:type 1 glutamine amidotransferase